jgi:hypothetical protein
VTTATFDTLDFSKRLQQLGFTREQAEGFAQMQREIIDAQLVTREYLDRRLNELEARLTVNLTNRFGVMLAAAVAVLAVLIKIL